jgi:hypothetical protein
MDGVVGGLQGEQALMQPFVAQASEIVRVEFRMATSLKRISGRCEFQLLDESRRSLLSRSIDLSDVWDSPYYGVNIDHLKVKAGSRYFWTLTAKNVSPENSFAIYASTAIVPGIGSAELDGKPLGKTLAFGVYSLCDKRPSWRWPFEESGCLPEAGAAARFSR